MYLYFFGKTKDFLYLIPKKGGNSRGFYREKVDTGQKCAGQRGGGMDGQGKGKGAGQFLHRTVAGRLLCSCLCGIIFYLLERADHTGPVRLRCRC